MKTIVIQSRAHNDWIDITQEVQKIVDEIQIQSGVVTLFVTHTTAGIVIQENADPPLKQDINKVWQRLFPWQDNYRHGEDNAAAHMKAILTGPSIQVLVENGRLILGTWQSIYFCEFDGPRKRKVLVGVQTIA